MRMSKTDRRIAQRRKKRRLNGGRPRPAITGGPNIQETVVVTAPPPPPNPEVEALKATPIGELMEFSTRARRGFTEHKVVTIGDLLGKDRAALKAIPGITDRVIERMRNALYNLGLDNESKHLIARTQAPSPATLSRTRRRAA